MKKAPFDLRKIKKTGVYKAAKESPSLQFSKIGQFIIRCFHLGMMKQTLKRSEQRSGQLIIRGAHLGIMKQALKRIEQHKRLPTYYYISATEHPIADILRKQEYYKLLFAERR